jgi:hypothetical protein
VVSNLRMFFRQPVNALGASVGLAVAAVGIGLETSGHSEAAFTLWVTVILYSGYVVLAQHRAVRRNSQAARVATGPVRTVRMQEAVRLPYPPERVWSLIVPAENGPLLVPSIARAYRVPGTPEGVGEQQASMDLAGNVTVVEVTEFVPNRRAVTKIVSPPPAVPVRSVYSLEPLGDGCLFAYGIELDTSAAAISDEGARGWRAGAQDYLGRVREALATWEPIT